MKNLEKLNVVELSASELQEVEGGLFWFAAAILLVNKAVAVGGTAYVLSKD